MKLIKRVLACILVIAVIMPLGTVETKAKETDHYVESVLENYQEYLEASQEYFWLSYDAKYAYELLADKMIHASFSMKLDMRVAYDVLGEKLTEEDCVQYLTTVMAFLDNGMEATVEEQAKYDTTKKASDYVEDAGALVGDVLGIQEAVGTAKAVQDAIGLASDTVDVLLETIDNIEHFARVMYDYEQHRDFLLAVAEHAEYKELKSAANKLLTVRDFQLGFTLEQIYDQVKDGSKYTMKAGGQTIIEETLLGWLEEKLGSNWSSKTFDSASELCAFAGKTLQVLKKVKAVFDVTTLASDIFIGNEYRYLKEVMVLDDMSYALKTAIQKHNPENETGKEAKYQMIRKQVPLLEALCAVRVRGEYCANMAAKANDTLFGYIMEKLNVQEEVIQKAEQYEKALELLKKDYQMIAEIFLVDDFVFSMLWKNQEITTLLQNGKVFCNADFSYPVVSYPSNAGTDKVISEYIENEVNEIKSDYLEEFGWEGPENSQAPYYNTGHEFGIYFSAEGRKDETVISIVGSTSRYYSGITHPWYGMLTYNFDTLSGNLLTMADIIENEEAYNKMCNLVSEVLMNDEKYKKDKFVSPNAKEELLKYDLGENCYPCWYFTSEGLVFSFVPGQITSYVAGYIEPVIPYSKLDGIVKNKYINVETRSEKGTDVLGEVVESVDITDVENYYYCDGPGDGAYTLAFSSEEMVYDVAIYELGYVDSNFEYVNKGNPIIALSSLSPASILTVDCGASSLMKPNLVVEWVDGTGTQRQSLYGASKSGKLIEWMIK